MARPNVILITVDHMRWDELGASGNPHIRTPNLDALASHGLVFAQATTGHIGGTGRAVLPFYAPAEAPESWEDPFLGALQDAGYQTGAVGTTPPSHHPFDIQASPQDASDATVAEESLHPVQWVGNQAVRYCQGTEEPFFLWAAFGTESEPPAPWNAMYPQNALPLPDGLVTPEEEANVRAGLAAHYGTLSLIDRQVGRMLATLTARGRTNNILIVTATHGSRAGYGNALESVTIPYHDANIRVPLIFGGLLGQRKGEREPALVSTADIPATILDVLELPPVALADSRSVLPQLRTEGLPHRKALVTQGELQSQAIRNARYKWIVDHDKGIEFIFDLQNDPGERENISDTRQAVAIRKILGTLI